MSCITTFSIIPINLQFMVIFRESPLPKLRYNLSTILKIMPYEINLLNLFLIRNSVPPNKGYHKNLHSKYLLSVDGLQLIALILNMGMLEYPIDFNFSS